MQAKTGSAGNGLPVERAQSDWTRENCHGGEGGQHDWLVLVSHRGDIEGEQHISCYLSLSILNPDLIACINSTFISTTLMTTMYPSTAAASRIQCNVTNFLSFLAWHSSRHSILTLEIKRINIKYDLIRTYFHAPHRYVLPKPSPPHAFQSVAPVATSLSGQ